MSRLSETVLEEAALAWLESTGWQVSNGAEIAPGELRVQKAEHAFKEETV